MKYDERNILFSRMRLKENTKRYIDYYKKHVMLKDSDDYLRKMARERSKYTNSDIMSFLAPKAEFEEQINNNEVLPLREEAFKEYDKYLNAKVNDEKSNITSEKIKEICLSFGADDVRITKLKKEDFYVKKGITQFNDLYNKEVNGNFKYAIVFACGLNKDYMAKAPRYEELAATEMGYDKCVLVSSKLAKYLKEHGHEAVTNNYKNYLLPMIDISLRSGLGQLGYSYMVVNKKLGSNIKTAAVLTNLELDIDEAVDFGLNEVCKSCLKCVERCPTQALSYDEIKLDDVKCMDMWLRARTDCGICISVCPFSKINTKKSL